MSTVLESNVYVNKTMCALCKGECCERMPGITMPEDFGSTHEEIVNRLYNAIKSGRYCFDYYEGNPMEESDQTVVPEIEEYFESEYKGYYVRPAIKGKEQMIVDPAWGGRCTFHTDNGCTLSYENRPLQCRLLKPKEQLSDTCKSIGPNSKNEYAIAWAEYHKEIIDLINQRGR